MSIKKIPDEFNKLLENNPVPTIHSITAKIIYKKSEDKMSFVEFELYLTKERLLPNFADIIIGKKKFTVLLYADKNNVYKTSPIPFMLGEKIAIYSIDGTIKFKIGEKIIKEQFSSMAINDINVKKIM